MIEKRDNVYAAAICTLLFAALSYVAFTVTFYGDSSDSVMHYLYAQYAFIHPSLFFNHWAKPLFVLLASPFAYWGFTGIKLFNCLCYSLACFFTVLTAKKLKLKYTYLIVVIMLFAPLYFRLVFSGLTEYLFAFFLILAIYIAVMKKFLWVSILVSFLPFIRSEGLIIEFVFFLYFIWKREVKYTPLLLFGSVIYSIAGCFIYHDLLWVFTKIPYTNQKSNHGHGGLFDFVHILNYVIEKPNFFMLVLGYVLATVWLIKVHLLKRPHDEKGLSVEEMILVFGGFSVFFIAHSIFWWKGLFNSGGFLMPRVMNAVVPLIAIIILEGVNLAIKLLKLDYLKQNLFVFGVGLLMILYPFKPKTNGLVYNRNLFVVPEEKLIDNNVVPFVKLNFPAYKKTKMYFSQPLLALQLQVDIFDSSRFNNLMYIQQDKLPMNTMVIWDGWMSPHEDGVSMEALDADKRLSRLKSFEVPDNGRTIKYVIYSAQ